MTPSPKEPSLFPMRINKFLAHQGYATRTEADTLIEKGLVLVNGKKAVLGQRVEKNDVVEVKAKKKKTYRYFAYNKPRGIVSHSAQGEDIDIATLGKQFPVLRGTFPIGRLDKDSHGLILLTDDGRVTDRLLSPSRDHEKEYVVRTQAPLRSSFKEYMERGVQIEDYHTKKCKVRIMGESTFSIILTEGKKHQIRRMVVAMHNQVKDLKRVRVMNITLGKLPEGEFRPIEGDELKDFLASIGLV